MCCMICCLYLTVPLSLVFTTFEPRNQRTRYNFSRFPTCTRKHTTCTVCITFIRSRSISHALILFYHLSFVFGDLRFYCTLVLLLFSFEARNGLECVCVFTWAQGVSCIFMLVLDCTGFHTLYTQVQANEKKRFLATSFTFVIVICCFYYCFVFGLNTLLFCCVFGTDCMAFVLLFKCEIHASP